jgi:hypothetical protein
VAPGGSDNGSGSIVRPDRSILSLLAEGASLGIECREEHVCEDLELDECRPFIEICERAPWVVADGYARNGGTSMATAHVSGVAALLRSRPPELTRLEVRQALIQSAEDLDPPGWDRDAGYGRVNARRAVEIGPLPVAEIQTPQNLSKVWERSLPFEVRGTVDSFNAALRQWRLTVRREGQASRWQIGSGRQPVDGAVLGTLRLGGRRGVRLGRRYVLELEVEDETGTRGLETKVVLIPDPRFAPVPLPDPFDEGGFSPTISEDGVRMAVTRADLEHRRPTGVCLFDSRSRTLRCFPETQHPTLSPDGGYLFYHRFASGFQGIWFHDIARSWSYRLPDLPSYLALPSLSTNAEEIAYGSGAEVKVYNHRAQFKTGAVPAPYQDVQDVRITRDGRRVVFSAATPLRPTGTAQRQVFLFDVPSGEVHQLTKDGIAYDDAHVTIDAEASKVAFRGTTLGLFLLDATQGTATQVWDATGLPQRPFLSSDGNRLVFTASLDIDPRVGNEDLYPEVFVHNLSTGEIGQVTDWVDNSIGYSEMVMDGLGDNFVVTAGGELNGLGLRPPVIRVVPRRRPNEEPVLTAPGVI